MLVWSLVVVSTTVFVDVSPSLAEGFVVAAERRWTIVVDVVRWAIAPVVHSVTAGWLVFVW